MDQAEQPVQSSPEDISTSVPTVHLGLDTAEETEATVPGDNLKITNPPTQHPSVSPTKSLSYVPGKLTHIEHGLLLSQGLRARIIAESGQPVRYNSGENSSVPFHFRPDAGATFEDIRPSNRGGWVYVSNSEMRIQDAPGGKYNGGVGAVTFSASGEVLKYEMVLENTTWNCGGGKTPWSKFASRTEACGLQFHLIVLFFCHYRYVG